MRFERKYTQNGISPYSTVTWVRRTSKVTDERGNVIYENNQVEVPDHWDQVATDILASKYFRRAQVPNKTIPVDEPGMYQRFRRSVAAPDADMGAETSLKQSVHRLVGNWTYWAIKEGYITSEVDAEVFYDELVYMILHQYFSPNSPQWFNTGLGWAYGTKNKDVGYYFVDPSDGQVYDCTDPGVEDNAITRGQAHACFILSLKDQLIGDQGICEFNTTETKIFKRGSGTGVNASQLRGHNEALSSGGTSSGMMSFLKIFDRNADSVKSGGTSRRAAKMVIVDDNHPEVEDFIEWKFKSEQQVAAMITGARLNCDILNDLMKTWKQLGSKASETHPDIKAIIKKAYHYAIEENYVHRAMLLAKQGYDEFPFIELTNDFNGEAYHIVSGQNSNNSIRVSDDFLTAVKRDKDWNLTNRTDGSLYKTKKAKFLWERINYCAWSCADPGLQFSDTINSWNTVRNDGLIEASNPCSEYFFLNDTACNLASIRLSKFYDEQTGVFDIDLFKHSVLLVTTVLELSVSSAILATKQLAQGTENYRTLGVGYADMGSLLMRKGIAYDSDKGRAIIGAITAIMTSQAYITSALMAKDHGCFNRYEDNKEHMLRVIRNHRRAAYDAPDETYEQINIPPIGISAAEAPADLLEAARAGWDQALELGEKYGYRNAHVTVLAPTGTIGLLMDCDTTGIEPDFSLVKYKKLSGGGYFKIANRSLRPALFTLGYSEDEIKAMIRYVVGNASLNECPHINEEVLKNMGLSDSQIDAIESSLKTAFNIEFVFNKHTLGVDFCSTKLGITPDELENSKFSILQKMGFSSEQIAQANEYICGTGTMEGAPHLKPEHYAVFDCAIAGGEKGKRSISYEAHLKAMAAAQPFLSGAISKTINLPVDCTVEDVEKCHWMAHEQGIKSMALYRNASKLSQPLNSSAGTTPIYTFDIISDEQDGPEIFQYVTRQRLPKIRRSKTIEFSVQGSKVFINCGEYDDGRLGEVFINCVDAPAEMQSLYNLLGRGFSHYLQHGCPPGEYLDMFRSVKSAPQGLVNHPNVKTATSIPDAIGKIIAVEYFKDKTAAEVIQDEGLDQIEEAIKETSSNGSQTREVLVAAYDQRQKRVKPIHQECEGCGSTNMTAMGSCKIKCNNCGNITGSCGS